MSTTTTDKRTEPFTASDLSWTGAGWLAAAVVLLVPAVYSVILHGLALTGFVCIASSDKTRSAIVTARDFVSAQVEPLAAKLCGERRPKE